MKDKIPFLSDEDDLEDNDIVKVIDLDIYFYSNVNKSSFFELKKSLHTVNKKISSLEHAIGKAFPVNLHVNSIGGSLTDGFAIMDMIKSNRYDVHTYVEGHAISAGSLISISGKKRFITKHSFMLIHQLSSIMAGTYENMKDEINGNKKMMKLLNKIYKKQTRLKKSELRKILKRDIWFTSKECLKYGLVDKII